jgi:hypothetical protein
MAQFVPVALAVVSAGAGVAAAAQQRRAGKMQEFQYKEQAKQEGDAARQREIDRKRNLLRALASQNAGAGASGADMAGSLQNIARVDIEDAADDLSIDRVNSGNIAAAGSLLDTANSTYKSL